MVRPVVPFAVETPDRVPKARYLDAEFFAWEAEHLWPRVWQMACRLEEIPDPFDVAEYEILDQSVLVVRADDGGVRAFQNACRHRGVRLVEGRTTCADGFTCPFHGWCYGADGANTRIPSRKSFSEHNLEDVDLVSVRCETWGGCVWINLDVSAPPLRECLEPAASALDAWRIESLRTEWWYAARLPVNWKLAIEAFVEAYHVVQTHPQLVIPTRYGSSSRQTGDFDARAYVDADLQYLRTMSEGMAGMVHANDVRIAEGLRDLELPADRDAATVTWNRTLNDAVTAWHRDRGADMPDLNELSEQGLNQEFFHCFPHWFVLPMYSSATAYRFRPLAPEVTLMEISSLTRFPDGEAPARPEIPEVWAHDDPRWPPIPTQDFSNLPRQQRGLHARGFEFMRLSAGLEGHISNFERTIDGYLAGRPHDQLRPALHEVNGYPFDRPIVDLGL
jgi:phenylpropionate dioxygenase-like ring-hydroxylating dioxygenase large terminal subunit